MVVRMLTRWTSDAGERSSSRQSTGDHARANQDLTPDAIGCSTSFEFDLRPHHAARSGRRRCGARSPTRRTLLLAQWLLPVDGLGLEPGTEFTFQAPPQPGWDGTVHCRTLAVDEPRSLSYAWMVGDDAIDTVVTFTLTPTASGTLLSLEQSGFRSDQRQAFGGARYGWNLMGERLVELLARTQ
jgi:uncharacterized protein YndB with AHSA1/START domain